MVLTFSVFHSSFFIDFMGVSIHAKCRQMKNDEWKTENEVS